MRLRMSSVSHMNQTHLCEWLSYVAHMNESCHTDAWVMFHIWMNLILYIKKMRDENHKEMRCESEGVMPTLWISLISVNRCGMSEYSLFYRALLQKRPNDLIDPTNRSNMWYVAHMNGSCHTCEWVMSHIWMRLIVYTKRIKDKTHKDYKCDSQWVMLHIWISLISMNGRIMSQT